jgi:hypothetical protein
MRSNNKSVSVCSFFSLVVIVSTCLLVATGASAQENAICTAATGCLTTAATPAFFDASVPGVRKSDICLTIFDMLTATYYPIGTGAVIDARGLPAGTTSMVCARIDSSNPGSKSDAVRSMQNNQCL